MTLDTAALPFRPDSAWQAYETKARRRAQLFRYYQVQIALSIVAILLLAWIIDDYEAAKPLFGFIVLVNFSFLIICGRRFEGIAVRFLLLRPFGERTMTRDLKRFVVTNLGNIGQVYTLSDQNYRPNSVIRVLDMIGNGFLLFFSPFILNSPRVAIIKTDRSIARLDKFLATALVRTSVLSFISGGQALNIRCIDALWKNCILMLMRSCDIIVVDLTKVEQGTVWELDQIRAGALLPKCLFIAKYERLNDSGTVLQSHLGHRPTVYGYGSTGTLSGQQEEFKGDLQQIALVTATCLSRATN